MDYDGVGARSKLPASFNVIIDDVCLWGARKV